MCAGNTIVRAGPSGPDHARSCRTAAVRASRPSDGIVLGFRRQLLYARGAFAAQPPPTASRATPRASSWQGVPARRQASRGKQRKDGEVALRSRSFSCLPTSGGDSCQRVATCRLEPRRWNKSVATKPPRKASFLPLLSSDNACTKQAKTAPVACNAWSAQDMTSVESSDDVMRSPARPSTSPSWTAYAAGRPSQRLPNSRAGGL